MAVRFCKLRNARVEHDAKARVHDIPAHDALGVREQHGSGVHHARMTIARRMLVADEQHRSGPVAEQPACDDVGRRQIIDLKGQ